MTRPPVPPLKRILTLARPNWDRPETRPAVREAFRKVLDCGTAALCAEVSSSTYETRVIYHTCKSRACPSCGYRATTLWQREQWRELPDIPYNHVSLTMPDVLWPLFQHNRRLLHDLPVLGAKVIEPGWHGKRSIYPEDIATTIYSALGIDWTKRIETTPSGRTFYYVEPFSATNLIGSGNQEISELFA